MSIIVKFDACGTMGQKTGEIFIVADQVAAIVPHAGSSGKAAMCHVSIVGAQQAIMVMGSATDAINKLGFTLK